jgi:drug/metabolite transporter (DMT)-like permease
MRSIRGLIMAILSSATFGLIPLFSIPLMENGNAELQLNLDNVCFYRFLFSALLMGVIVFVSFARKSKGDFSFRKVAADAFSLTPKQLGLMMLISVFYASTSIFLTASYTVGEIPSGIATTMHFLYPVFVTAMMILFFGEKFTILKAVSVALAFGGVFFLSGASFNEGISLNPLGLLFVLVTIFTYGSYIIGVNNLKAIASMNGMKLTFYVLAFSCLLFCGNIVVKGGSFQPLVTFHQWWNILALAFVPTLISDLTLVYAIQIIGSTTTAILGCMEPLTAVLVGITVFGERLNLNQGIGMALVFIAVYLVIIAQSKKEK